MKRNVIATTVAAAALMMGQQAVADVVHLDDTIVTGSVCAGFDCVNGESFGFDTLRLKENNLRIKFQDTSNSGSFPTNDWQITANDSSNGGANKFSIEDIDGGKIPFTIIAGAPSNSLYVNSSGLVGFGTSTPVVELHTADGDSPTLRLEQNGSSGFTPQTWDVAGNETNFFIRDVTNGSRLPFKIRPSAPTNSLYIDTDGDIGFGTSSPDSRLHVIGNLLVDQSDLGAPSAPLHVRRSDGTASLLVQETSTTVDNNRTLITVENNGNAYFTAKDSRYSEEWRMGMSSVKMNGAWENEGFRVGLISAGNHEFAISKTGEVTMGHSAANTFYLDESGNLTISGALTQNSDKNSKENFMVMNSAETLATIEKMPITRWNYKFDDTSVAHIGPMAQDFYAAFQLGEKENRISPLDVASVGLIGVQQLSLRLKEKDTQLSELKSKIKELESIQTRVSELEIMVNKMAQNYANSMSAEMTIK